jgi:hypothetical protein
MKVLGATTVVCLILFFVDEFVCDGRHTAVVAAVLGHVAWLVGLNI